MKKINKKNVFIIYFIFWLISKVSRTIGDIEAKLVKYGGNPKVVIPEPEIK